MVRSQQSRIPCLILTAVAGLGFCIQNNVYRPENPLPSALESVLWQIKKSFVSPTYVTCVMIVLLYFAFCMLLPKEDRRLRKWGIPFSAAAAVIVLLCESYHRYNSWDKVFGSPIAFFMSLLRGAGIAVLFYFIFILVNSVELLPDDSPARAHARRRYFLLAVFLLLMWLPYMIALSPGCMNVDTRDQFAQILGNEKYCWSARTIVHAPGQLLNNHHPVFMTGILAVFVWLGGKIGSYPWAFEIYCMLQCTLLAGTFSCLLYRLEKMRVPRWLRRCVLAFFALNPIFPAYGMTVMKDTPFAILMVLCVIRFYDLICSKDDFTVRRCVTTGILFLLLMLVRNNGFYILLLLVPFLLVTALKQRGHGRKLLLTVLVPMLIYRVGVVGILFPALHIADGSVREMLSVPFQQTARYIRDYGDDVSEEEAAHILAVLQPKEGVGLEAIGASYVPTRADDVKEEYQKTATGKDLKNYLFTWFSQFWRHPDAYVEAFFNLNYSWFTTESKEDNRYYKGIGRDMTGMLKDLDSPAYLEPARSAMREYVRLLAVTPFTVWMVEFSFYTWFYLILLLVMLIRKKYKVLLACGVIYANYLINFAGPVPYMRYAVPMMVCAPFVLALVFSGMPEKKEKD